MVFSSLEFIFVFLASVLAVYYLVPPKARNIVLLLFSLVFYGWGEPVYVFLMIATITVDYICGYIIGRDLDSKPKRAKVTLIVSIVINLALLGVFKYYDFFAGTPLSHGRSPCALCGGVPDRRACHTLSSRARRRDGAGAFRALDGRRSPFHHRFCT